MEEIVTLYNKKHNKLFGIVHIPEKPLPNGKKIGVNLLHPGVKYRVAPNRMNVKIARKLCQKGYYVFRFDPIGIGDSEGDLPENILLQDIFEEIQKGLFVSDTIDANDFFCEKYGLDQIILMGNCGGAITSIFTANEDSRVDAICLIDVPINFRTSKMTFADKVTEGGERADWLLFEYFKRIFNPKAWHRFFTFKTEYRALWKLLVMKIKNCFSSNKKGNLPDNIQRLCYKSFLNKYLFECIENYIQTNKKILFVVADNDPGTEIFMRYFKQGYLDNKYPDWRDTDIVEVSTIKNANHAYTLTESQEDLISRICTWIDSQMFYMNK